MGDGTIVEMDEPAYSAKDPIPSYSAKDPIPDSKDIIPPYVPEEPVGERRYVGGGWDFGEASVWQGSQGFSGLQGCCKKCESLIMAFDARHST